jgi:hypothetical protein
VTNEVRSLSESRSHIPGMRLALETCRSMVAINTWSDPPPWGSCGAHGEARIILAAEVGRGHAGPPPLIRGLHPLGWRIRLRCRIYPRQRKNFSVRSPRATFGKSCSGTRLTYIKFRGGERYVEVTLGGQVAEERIAAATYKRRGRNGKRILVGIE